MAMARRLGDYGFFTTGTRTSVFFVPTTGFLTTSVSVCVPATGVLTVSVRVVTVGTRIVSSVVFTETSGRFTTTSPISVRLHAPVTTAIAAAALNAKVLMVRI